MIVFLTAISILTIFFAAIFLFLVKKVNTTNRGGLMIILSGSYFTLFFYIAHVLRENFK